MKCYKLFFCGFKVNTIYLVEFNHAGFGAVLSLTFVLPSPVVGLLPDIWNCGLPMRRECRERFPHHRGLAIPACISARASRTCRDVCRDRWLAVSFEVGGGENVPGIPGVCANHNLRIWQEAHAVKHEFTKNHRRQNDTVLYKIVVMLYHWIKSINKYN